MTIITVILHHKKYEEMYICKELGTKQILCIKVRTFTYAFIEVNAHSYNAYRYIEENILLHMQTSIQLLYFIEEKDCSKWTLHSTCLHFL